MKVRLIWVGRTRNQHLKALIDDYLKRIGRFVACSVTEVKEDERSGNTPGDLVKEMEAKGIERALKGQGYNVILDPQGRELSSKDMADLFRNHINRGTKQINFIVGGVLGIAPRLRARANLLLSLSRLTFTHEMARLILVEQIYRALAIIHGVPYQK